MAFDGIVIKKVTEELKNLNNYKIDKVLQPDKNTIILGMYAKMQNLNLLINIANNYRIHLTNHTYKNPLTALNFCMFLRKHIIGYKITNIYSKDLERIVFIELENDENPDKIVSKTLVVELMGKHSNIILLNSNGIILDSLRHTYQEENALRDIYPTARFCTPKASNFDFTLNNENTKFINCFDHLSIKITQYKNDIPKDFVLCLSNSSEIFSLNYALDNFYYLKESSEIFKNYRNTLLNLILATLKKYEKRLFNIDEKLHECNDMEKYRLYGELITANLYKIKNTNLSSISLENYYDNNNLIEIPLDKKYLPNINAKRYFKKYSKLKNALEIVSMQKKETLQDIKYIESIIYEIENSTNIDDINSIYEEIAESPIFESGLSRKHLIKKSTKKNKTKQMTSNKFLKFNPLKFNIDGFTVFVGRNNKENDYLTNKFANKFDLWFHTKDIHGSHVILKTNPGEQVPENVIYECAKLASIHSKAKNSSNIPVDYCQVKFVKKIPGNKPGLVIYSNNNTIFVK